MGVDSIAQTREGARPALGVYSETDPLKRVALWGPIGAEAVLAQMYPLQTSLFFSNMHVPTARNEAAKFADLLSTQGIESFLVRDELGKTIKTGPCSDLPSVRDALELRASTIYKEHKDTTKLSQGAYADLMDQIPVLLEADAERYGEERAIALNYMLSLDTPMPLGNLMFARDQMNMVMDTRVASRMTKRIRTQEVPLFNLVYGQTLGDHKNLNIPEWDRLEGGDIYVHDNTVYVGVGPRSSAGAAHFLFRSLEGDLRQNDLHMAIVEDEDFFERPSEQQMDFMHLDTFSNPIGKHEVVVCEEAAVQRRVKFFERNGTGIYLRDTGLNFIDHLVKQGNEIITIAREEQQGFGCNFLTVDGETVIVPLDSNTAINAALQQRGKKILYADLVESTKGYGAAHCMTGQLLRERSENGR